MPWKLQVIFFVVTFGGQIFLRSFIEKISRFIYWFISVLSFVWVAYLSFTQYFLWKFNEFSRFLLPPYQDIFYFIEYVGWRFFLPTLIVFLLSLIFIVLANKSNRLGGERFFHEGEIYIAALAFVGSGYPGVIIFILCFLLLFLVVSIFSSIFYGREQRTSPYYLWIPSALIAILITRLWLSDFWLWNLFKI
jgi:hypothetical protein